jgi:hypothetical protein
MKCTGEQKHLLTVVKCHKIVWFDQITQYDSVKNYPARKIQGAKRQRCQQQNWPENIKEWT